MDSLQHEQFKELQNYRAIKLGGLKLVLAMAKLSLTFSVLVFLFLLGFIRMRKNESDMGDIIVGATFVFVASIMLLVLVDQITSKGAKWFRDYWRHNVVGNVARCWINCETGANGTSQVLCFILAPTKARLTHQKPWTKRLVAIDLALGGWFAKTRFLRGDGMPLHRLNQWSASICGYSGNGVPQIALRKNRYWGTAECIVVDIEDALVLLELIETEPHSVNCIADLINWGPLRQSLGMDKRVEHERRMETV